jgi:hypothetical protein
MTRILLALALLAPQERLPVERHPWMKYKVGTSITYTITFEGGGQKTTGEAVYTLKEKTDDGYVRTAKTTFEGAGEERSEQESRPVRGDAEAVRVGGESKDCVVWTASGKGGEGEVQVRFWLPAGGSLPLRVASKTASGDETDLVATSLKEEVEALGKKFACVRLEGKRKTPQGELALSVWMAEGIPGGGARLEMSVPGGGKITLVPKEVKEAP